MAKTLNKLQLEHCQKKLREFAKAVERGMAKKHLVSAAQEISRRERRTLINEAVAEAYGDKVIPTEQSLRGCDLGYGCEAHFTYPGYEKPAEYDEAYAGVRAAFESRCGQLENDFIFMSPDQAKEALEKLEDDYAEYRNLA